MQRSLLHAGPINELGDREAMGLGRSFVESEVAGWDEALASAWDSTPQALVACVQSAERSLAERLAAGAILGLKGDPRIEPDAPEMIRIAGGRIRFGLSPERVDAVVAEYRGVGVLREWIEKETPEFEHELEDFAIARLPVTNLEYRRFLAATGHSELPSSWAFGGYPRERSNHPVYSVSPASADAYAHWLSQRTGRRFRLPTELEWELAAAGTEKREFPWGERFGRERANTAELGLLATTPVGSFPLGAAACGALDMAGNVEEYTASAHWVYPGGKLIADDLYLRDPHYRIARGGSFTRFADLARCTRRHGRYDRSIYAMGLRLAESLG